ncbi:MAG: TRAP transporter TatT component family protein [Thermoanaerobaculia bacterium]|nr:TRAP transporter TatT component family protein [Thermoanaerobaculia bacterium]
MTRFRVIVQAFALLLLAGCASWSPGWKSGAIASPTDAITTAPLDRAGADLRFAEATRAEELALVAASYKKAHHDAADDAELLDDLADVHILYGAAWARSPGEKAEWYRAGIRYAERSMATDEGFRERVEAGATVGDAVSELGPERTRTMLLWVTGVSYYFKECLGVSKLWRFRWMLRTREVMERMLAVDPGFGGGAVYFSLGIYNLALPPGAGRDLDKSREFLDRAVATSPTSLLTRWGRAKYFHVMTGDRDAFRRDLEWVIAQDPRTPDNTLPWNLYFQRDAKETLARIDSFF